MTKKPTTTTVPVPPAAWKKAEAAAYLAISEMTLIRLVRAGEVPHTRVGRSLRFTKEALDAYLQRQTTTDWTPLRGPDAEDK